MLAAVVPVRNEEKRVVKTINTLMDTPIDLIIPVLNGSTDRSSAYVSKINSPRVMPLIFTEALGIDIPRAVGAYNAYAKGAAAILFLDGDMEGDIGKNICELLDSITTSHLDMSLTDCYPEETRSGISTMAANLLIERRLLNRQLGLEKKIGAASPAHGPHAVSRRFLDTVPIRDLAIPPVSLALASMNNLRVHIGTDIGHKDLGSPEKDNKHARLIAETIIGDCIEASCVFHGTARSRSRGGVDYIGYHLERRWDLLEKACGGYTDTRKEKRG